jgi:hypothetical protein
MLACMSALGALIYGGYDVMHGHVLRGSVLAVVGLLWLYYGGKLVSRQEERLTATSSVVSPPATDGSTVTVVASAPDVPVTLTPSGMFSVSRAADTGAASPPKGPAPAVPKHLN